MKKYILSHVVFLFLAFISKAQSSIGQGGQFVTAMIDNIKQLDTASTNTTLTELANNFERIAKTEKTRWQPYYYAAYCNALIALDSKDASTVDNLADKADMLLQSAESNQQSNSEITCLFAMIQSIRIMADPVNRFPTVSKEVHNLLGKAKIQDANNPRIYFLEAKFLLKTPEMFGGGRKIAKKSAEVAVAKFSTFASEDKIAPHWGEMQAKQLVEKLTNE